MPVTSEPIACSAGFGNPAGGRGGDSEIATQVGLVPAARLAMNVWRIPDRCCRYIEPDQCNMLKFWVNCAQDRRRSNECRASRDSLSQEGSFSLLVTGFSLPAKDLRLCGHHFCSGWGRG